MHTTNPRCGSMRRAGIALCLFVLGFFGLSMPYKAAGFVSAGLEAALSGVAERLAAELDDSSDSSGGAVTFMQRDLVVPRPHLWSLSLYTRRSDRLVPPVLLTNDNTTNPVFTVQSNETGNAAVSVRMSFSSPDVDIHLVGSGDVLAPGVYGQASPAEEVGVAQLALDLGGAPCLSADRGFEIERISVIDGKVAALAVTLHCGDRFFAEFRYEDTNYTEADVMLISGIVWSDPNGDGDIEEVPPGESQPSRLRGVRVNLLNADSGQLVSTMKTLDWDSNILNEDEKRFSFEIPTGNYVVEVVPPRGFAIAPKRSPASLGGNAIGEQTGRTDVLTAGDPEQGHWHPRARDLGDGSTSWLWSTRPLNAVLTLTRSDHSRAPIRSTALAPLAPGDRVVYHGYDSSLGFRGSDVVFGRAIRRRGSPTYRVQDTAGNRLTVSNDRRGLRLHKARYRIASGRNVPMTFSPPMVLLPGELKGYAHRTRGHVVAHGSNGRTVRARYDLDRTFGLGCCVDGTYGLRAVEGPTGPMAGVESVSNWEFRRARKRGPWVLAVQSSETWALGVGLVESTRPRSQGQQGAQHRVETRRAGSAHDTNGDRRGDFVLRSDDAQHLGVWEMDGVRTPAWSDVISADPSLADVVATADFDGDGHFDLLSRHAESGLVTMRGLDAESTPRPVGFSRPGLALVGTRGVGSDGGAIALRS